MDQSQIQIDTQKLDKALEEVYNVSRSNGEDVYLPLQRYFIDAGMDERSDSYLREDQLKLILETIRRNCGGDITLQEFKMIIGPIIAPTTGT